MEKEKMTKNYYNCNYTQNFVLPFVEERKTVLVCSEL